MPSGLQPSMPLPDDGFDDDSSDPLKHVLSDEQDTGSPLEEYEYSECL